MKKKILSALMIWTTTALAMDSHPIAFPDSEIVMNLVVLYYLTDHAAICALATTNLHYRLLILQNAAQRSLQLPRCPANYASSPTQCLGQFTHRYGSARFYAFKPDNFMQLVMSYHEEKNGKREENIVCFADFITMLAHNPAPYIDENKEISIYGYGQYRKTIENKNTLLTGVLRYQLCSKSVKPCGIIKDDNTFFDLAHFIAYPSLLQAILDSPAIPHMVRKKDTSVESLVFCIDKVSIPANYTKRIKLSTVKPDRCPTLKFEEFPTCIQESLERRYQTQLIKK